MQRPLRTMAPLSLRRTAGVLRLDGLLLAALLLPAALGLLAPLERSLTAVMAARPLTPLWFPLFILLGTLLPLVVRLAQLLRLRPLAAGLPWLRGLLLLELVLWGANALQMLLNRWLPLLGGA